MAEITKEQILDTIANMSVMDVVDLVKAMEEKFGVSAQAAMTVVGPAAGGGEATVVEEKTEFNVMLSDVGADRMSVIKVVRAVTGLGLKESKDLVESAPALVKEAVNKEEAANIKKQFEAVGAKIDVK